MQVTQGRPVQFRVSARRPATGRLESEALAVVRVNGLELPLEWDVTQLRYVGRASTRGWDLGKHVAVAEVRDSDSSELLGGASQTIDVLPIS